MKKNITVTLISPFHHSLTEKFFSGKFLLFPASNDMWGPDGLTTGSMGTVWAWALAG